MSMFPKRASFISFVPSWLCANKSGKDRTTKVRVFLRCSMYITGINLNAEMFLADISFVYSNFHFKPKHCLNGDVNH